MLLVYIYAITYVILIINICKYSDLFGNLWFEKNSPI